MALTNRQVRLAARPRGLPTCSDWTYGKEVVRDLGAGEVLVKVLYISLDPAMRGWMNEGRSYLPPVGIGEVMRAAGIGQVVASHNPAYAIGAYVSGSFGVQEYSVSSGRGLMTVDPALAPLPVYLNTLGAPGMTAYFGLLDIGRPQAGETVAISAAAGAVGSAVGQIARIKGCRVIGIAGGAEKCRYLVDELGFDGAIDYKAQDVATALKEHAPRGVDVYFDNVGGDILDAVLLRLRRGARIVVCGAISKYNATGAMKGPSNYLSLLVSRASMTGFVVFDYAKYYGEAARELADWMAEGRLKSREDIVEGLDTFPETLLKLFSGENRGKLILKIVET